MFTDPVFEAMAQYKKAAGYDVIRFELAIRAEIARCDQYLRYAFTEFHRSVIKGIRDRLRTELRDVLVLIPSYLDLKFKEKIKKTPFWDRIALKATAPGWKYTFYHSERSKAAKEITELLAEKGKVSVKQVKENM
jgi:hypothetical protein